MLQKPSAAVRLIRRLPKRALALRLWNRIVRLRGMASAETFFWADMRVDPKDIIQATILHFGVWEPEISEIVQRLVRRGDVAVDIGANVGYYSLLFARLGAGVVAIEAHPDLVLRLIEHDRINRAGMRVIGCAVAKDVGIVELFEAPRTNVGMSTIIPGKFSRSLRVRSSPLMPLLRYDQRSHVSFIKIDVEGAEAPIMREIAANLDELSDRLSICVEAGSDWSDAFDALLSAGFSAYVIPNDLATAWQRLLDDAPAGKPVRVSSFPREKCDLILTREELA